MKTLQKTDASAQESKDDDTSLPSKLMLFACGNAALGGLLFGYDWVVIGGAKPFYEPYFQVANAPLVQGWLMTSALVGCLFGALACGRIADSRGRRIVLFVAGILYVVSALGTSLADSILTFSMFRILGGIGIGFTSCVSPIYISEVASPQYRGRLVTMNQLAIVIGILLAQLINLAIANATVGSTDPEFGQGESVDNFGWRCMFAVEAIPAAIFAILALRIPESPRWLVSQNRECEAKQSIERLWRLDRTDPNLASIEIQRIKRANNEIAASRDEKTRRLLPLVLFAVVFQQWCGINVIFTYAQEVFADAGFGISAIMVNIAITGVVNLLFTILAFFVVDSIGRRNLMLVGAGLLSIIHFLIAGCYYWDSRGLHVLLMVLAAIACYATTIAPVTWVIVSEIFPNHQRGHFVALSVTVLWTACILLTFTFPVLKQLLGASAAFFSYGAICVCASVVFFLKLPETKGRTLEEIQMN